MEKLFFIKIVMFFVFLFFISSCTEEDNSLAPYAGSPKLSRVNIESSSFTPKITWSGGYASVIGVNRGNNAALDSSLIWLVYVPGNNLKYPVQFGELPAGAQDITSQYGGQNADSLSEDETYTFWILKEEAWTQISAQNGFNLYVDSTAKGSTVSINPDSISISQYSFIRETQNLDVYINIGSISAFGPFGEISVSVENSNIPLITWDNNSMISAVGIVEGGSYNSSNVLWEVFSERDSAGTLIYGKDNIISQPVRIGDDFPNTRVFSEFTLQGLERGKTYYVWVANNEWNNERARFAPGYAYATFSVN